MVSALFRQWSAATLAVLALAAIVEGALADYDKAIELNPQYADAYRLRGALCQDKGDVARATVDFDKGEKVGLQSLLAPKPAK